jgi:hypothetical protein
MGNTNDDFKELVYARIQAMPNGTSISIGDSGSLTKSQLLEHVEAGDDIGEKMIEVERAFFQALKDGSLYNYDD